MRTSGILRKKPKITELLSWRIQVWFQIILIHSATSQTSKRGAFGKLASSMLLWGIECPFLIQRLVLLRFTSSQGMRRAHVGVCALVISSQAWLHAATGGPHSGAWFCGGNRVTLF